MVRPTLARKLWHRLFGHGAHGRMAERWGSVWAWEVGVVCTCGFDWEEGASG